MSRYAACLMAAILASCTMTEDQQMAAARAYDRICSAEPPLYASFILIAETKKVSERTLNRAAAFHATITAMCEDRPVDFVSALVTLSTAYAQFATINNQVNRSA